MKWLPIIGVSIFIVLYVIATYYYPGGSQVDANSVGFSWINNYWCNLLNETAINGRPNTAQPIALTAMFILCLSQIFFWWQLANHIRVNSSLKNLIRIFGTFSMITAFLLFTSINHDLITNLASLFGLVAMVIGFVGLYRNSWKMLFYFGVFNLLLVLVNTYIYYNHEMIVYLPLIQKITFASFLTWVCLVNFRISFISK